MDQLKQREEGLSSRKQSPSWGTESPIPGVKNDSEVKVNPQIEKLAK